MKRRFVPVSTVNGWPWLEADEINGEWVYPDGKREPSIYTVIDAESFVANGIYNEIPYAT